MAISDRTFKNIRIPISTLIVALCLSMNTGLSHGTENNTVAQNLHCERFINHSESLLLSETNVGPWYSINDNVMGGKSKGFFTHKDDHLHFHGTINTNGGGFASIRKNIADGQLISADRIRLAIQSDGRAYNIQLQDNSNSQQSISHRAPLAKVRSDKFEIVEILFENLVPTFRGRRIQSASFNPLTAKTIGVILSDSLDGPFSLKLKWIEACGIKQ